MKLLKSDEAAGLFGLFKPSGILSHPNAINEKSKKDGKALFDVAFYCHKDECYLLDSDEKVYLVHRLDVGTSGCILVSNNRSTAQAVKTAFRDRQVNKIYHTLVFGSASSSKLFSAKAQPVVWRDDLKVDRDRAGKSLFGVSVSASGGPSNRKNNTNNNANCAETVVLSARAIGPNINEEISLLELRPLTGMTHQLRIQCAVRGMPIVGDATYGDFALNKIWNKSYKTKRLYLHASSISLSYAFEGGVRSEFSVESELPIEFSIN